MGSNPCGKDSISPKVLFSTWSPKKEQPTKPLHLVGAGMHSTESVRAEASTAPSHEQHSPGLRPCGGGCVR